MKAARRAFSPMWVYPSVVCSAEWPAASLMMRGDTPAFARFETNVWRSEWKVARPAALCSSMPALAKSLMKCADMGAMGFVVVWEWSKRGKMYGDGVVADFAHSSFHRVMAW